MKYYRGNFTQLISLPVLGFFFDLNCMTNLQSVIHRQIDLKFGYQRVKFVTFRTILVWIVSYQLWLISEFEADVFCHLFRTCSHWHCRKRTTNAKFCRFAD